MKRVNIIIPAYVKNARRAEKLASDDFWAYHLEISKSGKLADNKYRALRRRMIAARDRRVEAVREFTMNM